MECILLFLEKYSNVLIAFFAFLTTIATFLIWNVSRKQTEASRKQAEYTCLMGKAAEQPIITVNYTIDDLHNYTVRNNFDFVFAGSMKILVIQINSIGRGQHII